MEGTFGLPCATNIKPRKRGKHGEGGQFGYEY